MTRNSGRLAGIAWMIVSVACFALMHTATKVLAMRYSSLELATLRGGATLPLLAVWVGSRHGWRGVANVRWALQIVRGASTLLTVVCVAYALRVLPLANAYSIGFVGPLLIALLSWPVLKETVNAGKWAAMLVGFAGALTVVRPHGFDLLTLGGLAMMLSALGYACSLLLVRILCKTDNIAGTLFWGTTVMTLGAGLLSITNWKEVAVADWTTIFCMALTGVAGQYTIMEALRVAPAAVIAPFEYLGLPSGMTLDWLFWNHLPDPVMLVGAAMIMASGGYIAWHEHRASAQISDRPRPASTTPFIQMDEENST